MIILLNAPPSSGKSTLEEYIRFSYNKPVYIDSFAKTLKKVNQSIYELPDARVVELDRDHKLKERQIDELYGKSWRQVNIEMSKELKDKFGKEYFGESVARRILAQNFPQRVLVTDLGFIEELPPLVKKFGSDNIAIVQILRNGCDFEKDSRSYIDGGDLGIDNYVIDNSGSLGEFFANSIKLLDHLWK